MTNHYIDFQWSDVTLIMGANPAANHPISFKWITKAMERGGKLVCVDPRFTQSAAKAHLYAPLRSGTDIAFLGGMIKYIFDNKLYFEEYVNRYTNATFLVNPDFKMPGDNKGVFSGLTGTKYDKATWSYQTDAAGVIKKDPTMTDPRCVFQLLKKHYSRYTPDLVVRITGTPKDKLLEVYKTYTSSTGPTKAGNILYAMGWTQHTVGVQNIRTMAIIQLLLGNMGIPGGGVQALRGESNVQGSTDQGLLFHIWPGYIGTPRGSNPTLKTFMEARTPQTKEPKALNWPKNTPKYIASFLRSMYGMNATLDEAYNYLPKLDDGVDYSWLTLFDQMYKEKFTGFFAWGMNPAASGASSNKVRQAMTKLDWMVNVNLYDNETGSFWRSPGFDPTQVKTEVFMLPCASSIEKEGSISNSGRWMQWRYKAINPVGISIPDGDIMAEIYFKVKALYEKEGGPNKDAITKLSWNYGKFDDKGHYHLDVHAIAKEINGTFLADKVVENPATKEKMPFKKGQQVPSFAFLQDDGSTSSGDWVYCGSYTDAGNMSQRRGKADPTGLGLYPPVGLVLAGQPPDHLQRRLGPPRHGQALEPRTGRHQVGRHEVDGRRARRRGRPRQRPRALHHEARRRGLPLRAGPGRRSLPRALRTHGVPGGKEPHVTAVQQPRGQALGEEGRGYGHGLGFHRLLRPAVPLHLQHLPRDRALADGPADPLGALARGDAARHVCRDQRGAGQGARLCQRRARHGQDSPRRARCRGHRDAPHEALQHRRQHGAHGGHPLALRMDHHGGSQIQRQRQEARGLHHR